MNSIKRCAFIRMDHLDIDPTTLHFYKRKLVHTLKKDARNLGLKIIKFTLNFSDACLYSEFTGVAA